MTTVRNAPKPSQNTSIDAMYIPRDITSKLLTEPTTIYVDLALWITAVYIWRDPFWKYNAQCFCLDVEQVQIKLTKFGQTNRQPKLAEVRPTNKKTCRTGLTWYREAIPCQIYKVGGRGNNRWWRGDEAFKSVTGSDQIWLVLFGRAPQLNKDAERYTKRVSPYVNSWNGTRLCILRQRKWSVGPLSWSWSSNSHDGEDFRCAHGQYAKQKAALKFKWSSPC